MNRKCGNIGSYWELYKSSPHLALLTATAVLLVTQPINLLVRCGRLANVMSGLIRAAQILYTISAIFGMATLVALFMTAIIESLVCSQVGAARSIQGSPSTRPIRIKS